MIVTLCASALLSGAPAPSVPSTPAAASPNVLLIVLDDVGVDQIGSYAKDYPGLPLVPCTPNIDALATTGVRFTNAYCNPVCSPTRAQILTGKPALRTGVGAITFRGFNVPGNHGLQPSEVGLAAQLGSYESVAVGKWHVSDPNQDADTFLHPSLMGFDRFSGNLYGMDPAYEDWTKTISPPGVQFPNTSDYATTDTTADALAELSTLSEPWFLQVGYNSAHSPFHCPEDLGYDTAPLIGDPCVTPWAVDCTTAVTQDPCMSLGIDACHARAMVHSVDHEVGKLLASVDLANTVVILLGDNGTPAEPTVLPFVRNKVKGTVYQGGINVPLIVRMPNGITSEVHDLVSMTDLFATIADLTKSGPLTDPTLDSVSFVRLLFPGAAAAFEGRDAVYSEFFSPNFVPVGSAAPADYVADFHMRAVRNDEFKLIEIAGEHPQTKQCVDTLEFYRLSDGGPQNPAFGPDPFEENDLMPSMATWSTEEQAAFAELTLVLSTTYPRLPTVCD